MLVFDFDGVLADSLSIYQNACATAAGELGWNGQLTENPFAMLDSVSFGALAKLMGVDEYLFARRTSELIAQTSVPPRLFPDIHLVITELSRYHQIAILSNSDSHFIFRTLKHHQLDHAFSTIIGSDQPGEKAEKLASLGKKYPSTQGDFIMIGDSVSDIEAARACNCKEIAVSWGWQPMDKLMECRPEYTAHNPKELLALISELTHEDSIASLETSAN